MIRTFITLFIILTSSHAISGENIKIERSGVHFTVPAGWSDHSNDESASGSDNSGLSTQELQTIKKRTLIARFIGPESSETTDTDLLGRINIEAYPNTDNQGEFLEKNKTSLKNLYAMTNSSIKLIKSPADINIGSNKGLIWTFTYQSTISNINPNGKLIVRAIMIPREGYYYKILLSGIDDIWENDFKKVIRSLQID